MGQVTRLAKGRVPAKLTAAAFIKQICPHDSIPCMTIVDGLYEKGDTSITGQFRWKKGSMIISSGNNFKKIVVVNGLLPPMPKTLQEIRGQATADYQNYLDQKWITALRTRYPVVVNKEVLQRVR